MLLQFFVFHVYIPTETCSLSLLAWPLLNLIEKKNVKSYLINFYTLYPIPSVLCVLCVMYCVYCVYVTHYQSPSLHFLSLIHIAYMYSS